MKKLFTIAIFALLFTACSTDSEEITGEQVDFATNQASGAYDESNLGIYKGVFTTLSSSARATVYIKIDGVGEPYVEFAFPDGDQESFKAASVISKNASNSTTNFTSKDFSFDFTVNPDGTEPTITNLTYMGEKGDALIRKETSKAPVMAKTGTYVCETGCYDDFEDPIPHPELGPGSLQTYSFVLTGTPGNSDIDTQIVLNRRTYEGSVSQENCKNFDGPGDYIVCELRAQPDLNGNTGPIRFRSNISTTTSQASHIYRRDSDASYSCSSYQGTMYYDSTIFGRSTMSFATDEDLEDGGDCFNAV